MIVKCKQITSAGFDLNEVTTVKSNSHDYSVGGHGLELGAEYLVMGMAIYKDSNCVYYLIDVHGRPDWFPYLLFEVLDNTLPYSWFVRVNGKKANSDIYCLWGFKELCEDVKYYDQLTNRNAGALSVYFKRKKEIADE